MITILALIFVFSIVQSIMGVGLLVFGTPTFLILGYSFHDTLGIVLPPSILISLLQCLQAKGVIDSKFKKDFNFFCLPFVFIGLSIVLYLEKSIDLRYFVGAMLVFSGLIKFFPFLEKRIQSVLIKNSRIYQVFMGSIHGLTNMGGGLLTLFTSSIYKSKGQVRGAISYGYLLMGIIQYSVLLFFNSSVLSMTVLYTLLISGITFYAIGNRLFKITNESYFQIAINSIILFYGVALLVK